MAPYGGDDGDHVKARGSPRADQARAATALALIVLLPACSDRWAELDPRPVVANIFGAHLEGREPPPGLDQPWPNLASVPPRPEPPSAEARAALDARLAEDRERSRTPQLPSLAPRLPSPTGAPPPPLLAAAPTIRPAPPIAPAPPAAPAALPAPSPAPPPASAAPAAIPAPAPAAPEPPAPAMRAPDPVAPPPPPTPDLFAPPPPPADLLAPRGH
jgi:hypothetical protein